MIQKPPAGTSNNYWLFLTARKYPLPFTIDSSITETEHFILTSQHLAHQKSKD